MVRIYRPVYKAYRAVARENKISLSDLISSILMRVALEDISLVKVVLAEDFGMEYRDAWDVADDLFDIMNEESAKMWEEIMKKAEELDKKKSEEVKEIA